MDVSREVWNGAAGIVINEDRILMVRGKETGSWSIPSGGIENGESPQQACLREVWEETGFKVEINKPIHTKKAIIKNYDVTTYYFLCRVMEGQISYHDPDDSIEEVAWKTYEEILKLHHEYPEDQEILNSIFNGTTLKL